MPRKTTKRKTTTKEAEVINMSKEFDHIQFPDEGIIFRKGKPEDKQMAIKMWSELFNDTKEEIDHFFDNRFAPANMRIIQDMYSEEILSACHVIDHDVSLFGEPATASYLVGIGTPMEHQGRGNMDKLLSKLIPQAYKEGKEFLFLQPIEEQIYRRYGFGFMTRLHYLDFTADQLPAYDMCNLLVDRVEKVSPSIQDEKAIQEATLKYKRTLIELTAIYNIAMSHVGVHLIRDVEYYDKYLTEMESENGRIYIIRSDYDTLGYISFYLKDDTIIIREIITCLDPIDCQIFLSTLTGLGRYYPNIRYITHNGEMISTFREQLKVTQTVKPMMMLRILDIPKFLSRESVFFENFKFKLIDDYIPENNGVYEFDHRGNLTFNKKGKADLELTVDELNLYIAPFIKRTSYIQEYE